MSADSRITPSKSSTAILQATDSPQPLPAEQLVRILGDLPDQLSQDPVRATPRLARLLGPFRQPPPDTGEVLLGRPRAQPGTGPPPTRSQTHRQRVRRGAPA